MNYHVIDFGALGDGTTNDTRALQKAIDTCSQAGGGRVVLDGGHTYRCGMLTLRSFVELHLEAGAVLKASDNLEDFSPYANQELKTSEVTTPTYENCEYTGAPTLFFLYAKDCEWVSITGAGKIDGNESIFYGKITPWHIDGSFYPRMPLLFLEHITHLTLQNITLTGSAFWTTHLVGCEDVLIEGIRIINNLRLANCDGIDPDHCKNMRIIGCYIECTDDCIVFKNTENAMQYGACENITVSGCTLFPPVLPQIRPRRVKPLSAIFWYKTVTLPAATGEFPCSSGIRAALKMLPFPGLPLIQGSFPPTTGGENPNLWQLPGFAGKRTPLLVILKILPSGTSTVPARTGF